MHHDCYAYKVVKIVDNKFYSFSNNIPSPLIVEYKQNSIIKPNFKYSKLFVFDNYTNAISGLRSELRDDLVPFLCKITNPQPIKWYYWDRFAWEMYTLSLIERYERGLYHDINSCLMHTGTLLCDTVELLVQLPINIPDYIPENAR